MNSSKKISPPRNTEKKRLVFEFMRRASAPHTLQEIYSAVHKKLPKLAFSTVYRIVSEMEENGSIIRIDWRDRGSRYEIAGAHHHHLVCELCGKMHDIEDTDISLNVKKIAAKTGFVLSGHIVELMGLCEKCQKS